MFAVANVEADNQNQALSIARPIRSSADVGLAFVFTGQGAQYVNMGYDLVQYPVFSSFLQQINQLYASLGCQWSIFGKS
jgi:acyl transferase domain-containing protein